jgi:hypothetical protein
MKENKIEDRNYVVYKHTSPSNKVYIGITGQTPPEKRWANGHGYTQNEYFNDEIIQYGWDNFMHEILFCNLTRIEAQEKECEMIAYYKSTDKSFGYNIKTGGFRHILDNNEIRIIGNGSGKSSIPISQYTCLGEFIRTFRNVLVAEAETNICSGNIIKCCEGKLHSAGKFVWRYDDPKFNLIDYNYKTNRQVIQYTKNGIFICIYNSIIEAYEKTNVDRSSITRCCRGKQQTAGKFIWRYASEIQDPTAPLFPTPALAPTTLSETA